MTGNMNMLRFILNIFPFISIQKKVPGNYSEQQSGDLIHSSSVRSTTHWGVSKHSITK